MKLPYLIVLLLLFFQHLQAQSISLISVKGNKKPIVIKENNLISIKYKASLNGRKLKTIQGKLIDVTSPHIVVTPLFSKKTISLSHNQIVKIKRENPLIMSIGAITLTAGTFAVLEHNNTEHPANLFYSVAIAPGAFMLMYSRIINPLRNVDSAFYSKKNQWVLHFNE